MSRKGRSGIGTKYGANPYNGQWNPPETLKDAIGIKQGKVRMDAALRNANPNRDDPDYYNEWGNNCQRAVVAYELQRRGYRVTALPITDMQDRYAVKRFWDRANRVWYAGYMGAFQGARPVNVSASPDTRSKEAATREATANVARLVRSWGDGSRGIISATTYFGASGHVFTVENVGGKAVFLDPQSGRQMGPDALKRFSPYEISLTRTDNLRISERARDFVRIR